MRDDAPCRGCTNRHPACHGSCEAYLAWSDRNKAKQKYLAEVRTRFEVPWTASKEKGIRGYLKAGNACHNHGGMK